MTAPSAITAWAIKAPDGKLCDWTISNRRKKSLLQFIACGIYPRGWTSFYSSGYRCVRVTVQEMQE